MFLKNMYAKLKNLNDSVYIYVTPVDKNFSDKELVVML